MSRAPSQCLTHHTPRGQLHPARCGCRTATAIAGSSKAHVIALALQDVIDKMQYGSDAQSLGSKAHAISGRLHKLLQGPNGLKLGFSAFALVVLLMCVFP